MVVGACVCVCMCVGMSVFGRRCACVVCVGSVCGAGVCGCVREA